MDLKEFEKVVQSTVVLSEEMKIYYLDQNKNYSPKTRTNMTAIIQEEEINLADLKKKKQKEKDQRQKIAHQRLVQLKQKEEILKSTDEESAEKILKQIT